MRIQVAFSIVVAVLLCCSPLAAQSKRTLEPGPKNFESWIEFIRPSEKELAWEKIGWRNQFWPAVEEARKLGRPILLWTMNGHPLACT